MDATDYEDERFEAGDTYTDRECPKCNGLCFPIDPYDIKAEFNADEILTICELARMAMADAEMFDSLSDQTDEDLTHLRGKLQKFMDDDVPDILRPLTVAQLQEKVNGISEATHQELRRAVELAVELGVVRAFDGPLETVWHALSVRARTNLRHCAIVFEKSACNNCSDK
jgi:hypothetical protein